jgi:amidase
MFIGIGIFSCSQKTDITFEEINVLDLTIPEIQSFMNNGEITSESLVHMYLERIENFDKSGPSLNAVMMVNPDAISIAKAMDVERKNGNIRGPMHGIPVMIKDNIDTKDKMPCTAGSLLLQHNFPKEDAFIVKQLREAGAVLLGKTNLSEWANFRSTKSSSGWSSKGGQTHNPYDYDMSPCGSSAGSGVAVAANLCTVAIGTETDGSIACPSAVNGIVGIKPTVGVWSRSGIIPISHTQDTPGPMAKSVIDAAVLLSICTGIDEKDILTNHQKVNQNYTTFCKVGALKGKRLGLDTSFLNIKTNVGSIFAESIEALKRGGAEIVTIDYKSKMDGVGDAEFEILLYEIKHDMKAYLANTSLPFKTLEEIVKANEAGKDSIMPIFGQELFEMAIKKGDLDDEAYLNAKIKCTEHVRTVLLNTMKENKLDAIVSPTLGPSWNIDHENGDSFNGPSGYSPGAQAGFPHITVPMGLVDDLPVGITFMAGPYEEGKIIELAYDYEQKNQKRVKPKL